MRKKKKRLLPHERSINKDAVEFLERFYRNRQAEKEVARMDKSFNKPVEEVDLALFYDRNR